jgi:hypothetical protein
MSLAPLVTSAKDFIYTTTLGPSDFVSSAGASLGSVQEILRQDRANVHLLGKADPGDEKDAFFADKTARTLFEKASLEITEELRRRIIERQGVIVQVEGRFSPPQSLSIRVTLVGKGGTSPLAPQAVERVRYQTTLGIQDTKNSKGERLQKWGEVLAQDRANVNALNRPNMGDMRDEWFTTPERRAALQTAQVNVNPDVLVELKAGKVPQIQVSVHMNGNVHLALLNSNGRANAAPTAAPPSNNAVQMRRNEWDALLAKDRKTWVADLPQKGQTPWQKDLVVVVQPVPDGEERLQCISGDGAYALSTLGDLHVWDVRSHMVAFTSRLERHGLTGEPEAFVLSNSGRHLVVRLHAEWHLLDLETGARVSHWSSTKGTPVFSVSGDWLASCDSGGLFALPLAEPDNMRRWKDRSGQPWITSSGSLHVVPEGSLPPNLSDSKVDDEKRITIHDGFEIRDATLGSEWSIWDTKLAEFDHENERGDSLVWGPDNSLIVRRHTGDVFLDLRTLRERRPAPGHLQASSPSGQLFSSLEVPEFPTQELTWMAHDGSLRQLLHLKDGWQAHGHLLSPDGERLWVSSQKSVQGGIESAWRLLSTKDGRDLLQRRWSHSYSQREKEQSKGVALYSDHVLFAGENTLVVGGTMFDIPSQNEIRHLQGVVLGESKDRTRIAYLAPSARSWRPEVVDEKGRTIFSPPVGLTGSFSEFPWCGVAPDGRTAWLSRDRNLFDGCRLSLLDLQSGRVLHEFPFFQGPRPFFSNDSEFFFAPESHGQTSRISLSSGKVTERLPTSFYPIRQGLDWSRRPASKDTQFPSFIAISQAGAEAKIISNELKELGSIKAIDVELGRTRSYSASHDGRRLLLAGSYGGGFQMVDVQTGRKICDAYGLQTGDWLLLLPDGHYAASPRATRMVGIRHRGKIHPLDHFDLMLNRPDKVLSALNGDRTRVTHLEHLVTARLKAAEFTEASNAESLLSETKVRIELQELSSTRTQLKLRGHVEDSHQGDVIKITHNGIPMNMLKIENPSGSLDLDFPLTSGRNHLSLEIESSARRMSGRNILEVQGPAESSQATVHAVIIGVNDYPGHQSDLPGALSDAVEVEKALLAMNGHGQIIKSTLLTGQKATAENLSRAIKEAASSASIEDALLVYFAGHGVNDPELGFRFLDSDCDVAGDQKTGLLLSSVTQAISTTKALRRVLLIDACAAGNRSEGDTKGELDDLFLTPLSMQGIHVLGAARWNQSAGESDEIGHGFFTYALLQALWGSKTGAWNGGKLGMSRLTSYLMDAVPKLSAGGQTPAIVSINPDVDVTLVKHPRIEKVSAAVAAIWSGSTLAHRDKNGRYYSLVLSDMELNQDEIAMLREAVFARHGREIRSQQIRTWITRIVEDYQKDSVYREDQLTEDDRNNLSFLDQLKKM